MNFLCQFSKIYMIKIWLEIWYSCTNLVTFASLEKRSNKWKKKFNNTIKDFKTIIYIYIYIQVNEVTPGILLEKLHILSIVDL